MSIDDILNFWFDEIDPAQWWKKDEAFDQALRERFSGVHQRAARCELFGWRTSGRGRLAEVIVLDQFSRNMFRGEARAFACDPLALGLAQSALESGADQSLSAVERSFLYMPFMHSESQAIHEVGISLFEALGIKVNLDSAVRHRTIIQRFGRYPHRNAILDRQSTSDEAEFLQQPGSSF